MTLQYSSLLLAVSVSCVAASLTLAVSWAANRRDTFLLTWSCAAMVLVVGSAAFGYYAAYPTQIPAAVGTSFILIGFVICWGASRQFRCNRLPLCEVGILAALAIMLQLAFHWAGLVGTMLIAMNVASTGLLVATATEYWLARTENLASLKWLAGLYLLEAFSFACCAVMLVIESPFELDHAPQNWAETFNALVSIIGVTGIGGLSLAINQERVARDHKVEARTDALTGLLNRRAFDDLVIARSPQGNMAIIIFDLDRFKVLNDDYGHAFGDAVLRRFASVCSASLRKQDVAARIGGEEFAVVLTDCTPERALVVANRIRLRFARQKIFCAAQLIRCTVSAGVCGCPPGEEIAIGAMFDAADTALYAAKKAGRNRVCRFDDEMAA
ncbi:diguanylate cyclase (GGDEF)-like protein [Breoghania corrubedonensis]|uniref:diguanylate cyclase n=1 Tax=Breoghania corrubedonensis TaxID=665038 RepID=A0A2T5VEM0_9HYPH|nr:sensor domain-containing diguanylate cyclase [Breoghania corrubedonensis]PTW62205.1 diguanylate cyclase (GGDEF)-like protein [Breoghania corrubedonensis]